MDRLCNASLVSVSDTDCTDKTFFTDLRLVNDTELIYRLHLVIILE